ncbi:ribonuclease VapC [Thermoplasma sp. Kam2015]|uniref:type II toxin-antitoxin system VapC family toxin n=1 Tax=Thermoplasma sp. Kam2015 TaxID=2094122 RepID=UPI000D8350C8|nr:type II toxin-antitoxin system VapC family toxin [Thermoplasma sp. Kam2015]PYB69163.1 ribonuclease VapC [Thermoplasma sp. Kam2015]
MIYVIDTSAIISRNLNLLDGDLIFPSSVISEIKRGKLRYMIDALLPMIRVVSPGQEYLKVVEDTAAKTGDLMNLSQTDKDVLALALQYGGTIVTDDYSIQNVASYLNLKFVNANIKRIEKQIAWVYRCTGCKKVFSVPVKVCDICGHDVKRHYDKKRSMIKKV